MVTMGARNRPAVATNRVALLASLLLAAAARLGSAAPLLPAQTTEEKPLRRVELLVVEDRSTEVTVGLDVELAPGWYLYWLNPGDAGLAPLIRWQLPPGFSSGKLRFPTPQKMVHGDIVTYGFKDETLILCDIRRPAKISRADRQIITAVLDWMACRESCLTGETTVQVNLSGLSPTETHESKSAFSRFSSRYPKSLSAAELSANKARLIKSPGRWTVEISMSGRDAARASDFYPFPLEDFVIEHHGITIDAGKLSIPVEPSIPSAALSTLGGLMIIDGAGFEVTFPAKD
jgi:DsbC/DsbD-like thiol-disulfide interchange protein